jgi:hypothetical protein
VQRRELHLLGLQLELGAGDGGLELDGGLVAEGLVDDAGGVVVGGVVGALWVVVGGSGDRGEFEGEGELEVRFGDDFGFLGVKLLLVFEGGARVDDGVGIPRERIWRVRIQATGEARGGGVSPLVLQRDLGQQRVCVAQAFPDVSNGG